jgi:uncharacterized protein (TIGR03067 family)
MQLCLLSCYVVVAVSTHNGPIERDFDKWKEAQDAAIAQLGGEWEVVSERMNDQVRPVQLEFRTFAFKDRRYRTHWKEKAELGGKEVQNAWHWYAINPAKSPPEITFYGDSHLMQGIYSLDADTLKLAFFSLSEVDRPRGFTLAENPDKPSRFG